jgi:hypothetical protein
MSISEMGLHLDVSKTSLLRWADAHEEFRTALNEAQDFAQGFWEQEGRVNLENRDFNAALWKQNMAPRFRNDWTDKQVTEHHGRDGKDLIPEQQTPQEIARHVAFLLAKAKHESPAE